MARAADYRPPLTDPAKWRPAPLLPPLDAQDFGLVFAIAVLCFLACLAAMGALASDRAASGWTRELTASATIQVRPGPTETGAEAAARAAEAVAAVKGVQEAQALDRESAEALLEPRLGKGDIPEDMPLPYLVTVDLDPQHPATVKALNAALVAAHVDASVDDHSRWIADIERSAAFARGASAFICALIALAAASVVAFATRAGLAARRDVVEVLHLTGAVDRYVAGLFLRRFAVLAFAAGAAGGGAAALAGVLLRLLGGSQGFTPALPLAWADLSVGLAAPWLAGMVAALAARFVALDLLRREP